MPEPNEAPVSHGRAGRDLPIAIVTGLILAGLILGTLFTSRPAFFALVAAAALAAQVEFYRALRSHGFNPADLLGLAAGGLLLLGAYNRGAGALSFGMTMTVIAAFLWFLADRERERVAENLGVTLLGVVYVPFFAAHVILMTGLPHGPAITICYLGLVALNDVSAYATGALFGKHPMAPSVSPKKSWEGTIGATILMFLLALIVGPLITPFTIGSSLALAAVVTVVAPLGDLSESLIKRDLGVKDMGTMLPGHGGVLDRIDSLLLVAPAAYWLIRVVVF
ncbi:MAG: phosphatidate cytidylyltransferase [Actinomycetota bacterium]